MVKFFERLRGKQEEGQEPSADAGWESVANTEFGGEQEKQRENAERQQRKIIASLLYGHEYIGSPDVRLNNGDRERCLDGMVSGALGDEAQRAVLTSIKGPIAKEGVDMVFSRLTGDMHLKKILMVEVGGGAAEWDQASALTLKRFAERFPTPLDFEGESEKFLENIRRNNPDAKYQEYARDMAVFKRKVYGKRQEYWEQMKVLRGQAEERARDKTEDLGGVENVVVASERNEGLFSGYGVAERSKPREGYPVGYTEDRHLEMPEQGLFAVFDGVGGRGGGSIAAEAARAAMLGVARGFGLKNERHLAWALDKASEEVEKNPEAGYSTGVVGKIVDEGGGRFLKYANVGDSRIYIIRRGEARLITQDEGYENKITNALGRSDGRGHEGTTKQFGSEALELGDRIMFCTDGITGDKGADLMGEAEIAEIVGRAGNAGRAAQELVERARKNDDRAVIVVEV